MTVRALKPLAKRVEVLHKGGPTALTHEHGGIWVGDAARHRGPRLPARGDLRRHHARGRRPLPLPAHARPGRPAPDQRGSARAAVGGARRAGAPLRDPAGRHGDRYVVRGLGAQGPRGAGEGRLQLLGRPRAPDAPARASRACGSCSCPASAPARRTSTGSWAPTGSGRRRPTRWPSTPRWRRRRRRGSSSRRTSGATTPGWPHAPQKQPDRRADVGLRDAPRLVEAAPRRRVLVLRRARRRPGPLPLRPRVHPRRADAGDAAPVRRLVGLPRDVVLRPGLAVRRPRRLPPPGRPAAPGRHRRDPRLGAGPLRHRPVGAGASSTAARSTRTPTRSAAGTRSGAPTSSTSAATRCATSSTPTRSTGWRSSTPTGCASTASPRCSTSTTRATRASGRRTSTAAARTSRPSSSCRR